eukprot:CAMPEP_0170653870 /NCGR_PEP_ID=MMETSP0224-20130122/47630_1 /TAXON_ID=285029 /ORGANISM="Togula jolla, Strain CCCM 725" /LENGTH=94 /DNA_ID=CAMNT_0010985755 /DNA_START=442 /DNA_END=722 /DNA_ORIENTATION=+
MPWSWAVCVSLHSTDLLPAISVAHRLEVLLHSAEEGLVPRCWTSSLGLLELLALPVTAAGTGAPAILRSARTDSAVSGTACASASAAADAPGAA